MPPRPRWSWAVACAVVCSMSAVPAFAQLHGGTFAQGLAAPVAFVQDPSDATRQYVVEQAGRIRVIQNGTLLPGEFLNVSTSSSNTRCIGTRLAWCRPPAPTAWA